jgi:DNA-directed RNA polymerase subunit RPC12/RpoP
MQHGMKAVYCDAAECLKSGNDKKEIRVWYIHGTQKTHLIACPYCGTEISRNVPGYFEGRAAGVTSEYFQ